MVSEISVACALMWCESATAVCYSQHSPTVAKFANFATTRTALNRIPHRTPYIQCGAVHTKNRLCRGSSPPLRAGAALLPALLAPHRTAYATACGSMRFNAARPPLRDLAHIQKYVAQISLTCAIPHKYIHQNNTKYLGANVTIDPMMNLAAITERTHFDADSSAFVLLELLAAGHGGKAISELPDDELMRALDAACDRMDRLLAGDP